MTDATSELADICKELGCTTAPGVALRFVRELRRDLRLAHRRHVELIQTWDIASPTERQELDRMRRGWGPSTPTERMARREDLRAAMHSIETAMTAVLPDDKEDGDLTLGHFQTAYDALAKAHRDMIDLLHNLPKLADAPETKSAKVAPHTAELEALRERAAKVVEPKNPRPCDCERCECQNLGDAEAVASWDAEAYSAKAIRAIPLTETEAADVQRS